MMKTMMIMRLLLLLVMFMSTTSGNTGSKEMRTRQHFHRTICIAFFYIQENGKPSDHNVPAVDVREQTETQF